MSNKHGLIAAAVLLGVSAVASGASHGPLDAAKAARDAELIFKGTVEAVDYAFSDVGDGTRPKIPHTFVTYRIEKTFKGSTDGDTVTLRFVGGRGEEAAFLMVSGIPMFDVGDRDVLFVQRNGTSGCPLVDCANGRYRLIQGKVFTEEGQAIEQDTLGRLQKRDYYDLPEVMTHKVSMTTLTRHDQLDEGEERRRFVAPGAGTHLDAAMLVERIERAARSGNAKAGRRVASADRGKPFVIGALRAEAPPAAQAAKAAPQPKTAQERVELEALAANGGNPVIDDKTLKAVRGAR